MKIKEELIDGIISSIHKDLTIIAICGAADLGKSYLSNQLKDLLNQRGLITSYLSLDSYLMDRNVRIEKEISGYEIAAYSLKEAISDLIKLKARKPVKYKPYNHKTGTNNNEITKTIEPKSDLIIFDGLHVMHPSFMPQIDISIFLYTEDEKLKQIRKEADLIKRGYTKEYSNKISEKELSLYKNNIELYKKNANYLLFLESKWKYRLIKSI